MKDRDRPCSAVFTVKSWERQEIPRIWEGQLIAVSGNASWEKEGSEEQVRQVRNV